MKTNKSFFGKILLITLVAFLIISGNNSRSLGSEWSKIFDVSGDSVKETTAGGYIMVSGNQLIKTDSDGKEQWRKSFTEASSFTSVMQTTDEGYILAGEGSCEHCYYAYRGGPANCGMIKTDANGKLQWGQIEGSEGGDRCYSTSAIQTDDGGYVFLGGSREYKFRFEISVYLSKTDAGGNVLWSETYERGEELAGNSVQQTADGGFSIVASTGSFTGGGRDVYLIRTDTDGNEMWNKTFGGTEDDVGNSIQQ